MIRTEAISKHFKDTKRGVIKAVDGVSIEAKPSHIFGLLGVNGAGKTTVLRMLSTVIKPTSGKAEVAGFDLQTQPENVRANIGFLSSSTALYGRLNPVEVLSYFGALYGLAGVRLKQRVDWALETLAIGPFASRLCDKLSTGQKQRVSIARAILHDPPVLFFDEPTSGLDVVSSQVILEFIEGTRAQGKTVVFCTHIMTEAERLCDEIAVIHQGKILGRGSVQHLLEETYQPTLEKAFLSLVGYAPGAEAEGGTK